MSVAGPRDRLRERRWPSARMLWRARRQSRLRQDNGEAVLSDGGAGFDASGWGRSTSA